MRQALRQEEMTPPQQAPFYHHGMAPHGSTTSRLIRICLYILSFSRLSQLCSPIIIGPKIPGFQLPVFGPGKQKNVGNFRVYALQQVGIERGHRILGSFPSKSETIRIMHVSIANNCGCVQCRPMSRPKGTQFSKVSWQIQGPD